jgi:hypothetical protein
LPSDPALKQASTGDAIVQPLGAGASPPNPLGIGIHLHWELPDFFRRGVQPADGGDIVFPQTPNRWLVIRYLSVYNQTTSQYGPVVTKCWIVESDYIAPGLLKDADGVQRPAVSVPLHVKSGGAQPYQYMGRVLDLENWNPATETQTDFLPAYTGEDNQPLHLTSIGFVGAAFSAYYPECCSVFGFWDRFADVQDVHLAIENNQPPIQFKASYQVIGWINEPGSDPLSGVAEQVTRLTSRRAVRSADVPVDQSPSDVFMSIAAQNFRWVFTKPDVVPARTLCAGWMQEVVWNMVESPGTTLLNNLTSRIAGDVDR